MRKHLVLFACISFPLASQANTCQDSKTLIASDLYTNEEYRNFICGDEKCEPETFSEGISVEAKDLNNKLTGCFVTPIKKAENFYTGLYLLKDNKIKLQFIFFGSYLCSTKTIKNGHYIITGEERIDSESKERYIFKWNGEYYASTPTRRSYSSKKLKCQ